MAAVLETFSRGSVEGAAERFAHDGVYREARKPPICGRTAIAAEFARYAGAGATFRFTVQDVIETADRACVVYAFAVPGGAGEPWRERAGCAVIRFDERGQIAEWREYEG